LFGLPALHNSASSADMALSGAGSLGIIGRAMSEPSPAMQIAPANCEVSAALPDLADVGMRVVVRRTFLQIETEHIVGNHRKEHSSLDNVTCGCRIVNIYLAYEPALTDLDCSSESDSESEVGSGSSTDPIDIASEERGKHSQSDSVSEFKTCQHGISQHDCFWVPCFVSAMSECDYQWYVCWHYLSDGPPGFFGPPGILRPPGFFVQ